MPTQSADQAYAGGKASPGRTAVRLSIVIVNWNTEDLLRACLSSIRDAVGRHVLEVFVVDNASVDGSVSMVRALFPSVQLVENTRNVGFATANNQVIPRCRGDYILLLNSDTVLPPDALDRLVQFMEQHPSASAAGPRLIDPQQRPQVMAAGYLPTLGTVFNHFFFLSRLWPGLFRGLSLMPSHDSHPVRVEWLTGACLLVRNEVFQRVGLFSEEFFMYAEDIELCERMVRSGFQLYYAPVTDVVHVGGASSRGLPIEASTRWVTNMHRLFARRHSRGRVMAFDLIHGVGLAIRMMAYVTLSLRDRSSYEKARMLGASSWRAFALAGETLLTRQKHEP